MVCLTDNSVQGLIHFLFVLQKRIDSEAPQLYTPQLVHSPFPGTALVPHWSTNSHSQCGKRDMNLIHQKCFK